jgi:hypothetical protein
VPEKQYLVLVEDAAGEQNERGLALPFSASVETP